MAGPLRRRECLWGSVVLLALLGGAVAWGLGSERTHARECVRREQAALGEVRRLAALERDFHGRTGRYGWLEELRDAHLLDGHSLRVAAHGLQVLSEGYVIDVLLPSGRALADQVPLGTHAAGPAEPTLVDRHLALVARPERPGLDGYRIWYVDEEGHTFLCEGVSDVEGLAEDGLPPLRVVRSHTQEEPGVVWRRLEDVATD